MKKELQSYEVVILKELLKPNKKGVSTYFFHEKYLLSIGQLSQFILKYKEEEIIEYYNEHIKLTPKGKNWLFGNKDSIFFKRKQYWKTIPLEFKSKEILNENSYDDNYILNSIEKENFIKSKKWWRK